MSVFAGPKINNNGLMLAFDDNNIDKSWKGKPTTNHVLYPLAIAENGNDSTTGWNNYGFGDDNTFSILKEPTALKIGNCIQVTKNTTANGTINVVTTSTGNLNLGDTVTVSWYVKGVGGTIGKNVRIWAYNNSTDGPISTGVLGLGPLTSEFQRFSYTYTWTKATASGSGLTSYIRVEFGTGDRFIVSNPQIEFGSVVSPFVSGTRSNTQSLLDLTGKNTITVNNLTYSNNGTFSFNGTNSYIDAGNAADLQQSETFSAEAWVRITDLGGSSELFSKGNGLSGDGNLGWAVSYYNVTNTLYFDTHNMTTRYASVISHENSTNWFNIVVTFSSGIKKIYINGVLKRTDSTPSHTIGNVNYNFTVSEGFTWQSLMGDVAALRYYNRVLSDSEVRQNFNATRTRYSI